MIRSRYLLLVWGTLKSMKYIFIIAIVALFAISSFAQSPAADKNAIDLSAKLDTLARGGSGSNWSIGIGGSLNVGYKNTDNWEDCEILYGALKSYSKLRFGGPLLFDTLYNRVFFEFPGHYGDFDGDGIGDIIGNNWIAFYKGKKEYPYFDSTYTTRFRTHTDLFSDQSIGAIDYTGDGYKDFLMNASDSKKSYIFLWKGSQDLDKKGKYFPTDSLPFERWTPANIAEYTTVGKFGEKLNPYIILSRDNALYVIKNTTILSGDSLVLINDTVMYKSIIRKVSSLDITGDGVTDLLVSDGSYIYIYKGGDDFGTYPLTPATAFYTIASPRVLDLNNFHNLENDFGNSMWAAGDITGSGIPYLAVNVNISSQTGYFQPYIFFYAGGKALDSLYDAHITIYNSKGLDYLDTLHSINSSGRTVCTISDYNDKSFGLNDLLFLLSRECEMIPHKTNPAMVKVNNQNNELWDMSVFPSHADKFTKLLVNSDQTRPATVVVYDMLGAEIARRKTVLDPGPNIEFFTTTEWTSGTYVIRITTDTHVQTLKLIITH